MTNPRGHTGPGYSEPLSGHVGIVILTWNAFDHTRVCLESLFGETTWPDFEVIVVDNGSVDETLDELRQRKDITLIENGTNLGFVRGCNIGFAQLEAGADVIFLNNDVRITDGEWIGKLRDAAYAAPDIALVGCRQVDAAGRLNHAGTYMRPLDLVGESYGALEDDIGQYQNDREVESIVGAVVYAKRAVLDLIGPFDEEYHTYYEDTDLCMRAKVNGFRTWYCGELTLEHAFSATSNSNNFDFSGMYTAAGKVFKRKWARWMLESRSPAVVYGSTTTSPMGYAQMCREQMRALWELDTYVSYRWLYGVDDYFEPNAGDGLTNNLRDLPDRPGAVNLAAAPADLWSKVEKRPRVGYTMLEVDGLPRDWVAAANKMDEVWVPTQFNVETFASSGVTRPIHVVPLGIDVEHFNTSIRAYRKFDSFTFLSIFEWGERKAPEVLLRAFSEEFNREDGVALLIATTNRDPMVNIPQQVEDLKLARDRAPIILWINPELEGYQMGALYRSADAFVLPTRGEGWGLPVLEAMACGVPTIATDWSGHTAFFDGDVGYPVQTTLEPAIARCPYYKGFNWARPDIDDLRAQMRRCFENHEEAHAKATRAAERASQISWRASAEKIRERLIELS